MKRVMGEGMFGSRTLFMSLTEVGYFEEGEEEQTKQVYVVLWRYSTALDKVVWLPVSIVS